MEQLIVNVVVLVGCVLGVLFLLRTRMRDAAENRRLDDKQWYVLRCDHDVLIEESAITEHLEGNGPLLTCVRCFGMPSK